MKTAFGVGLLVGALLAAPLVSILYLLHTAFETPFTPFDLFDAVVRLLPGPVVSFGIDSMVRVLMFFGLSLSASSKAAEQMQAIGMFLSVCALASGIFFAVLSGLSGGILGIAMAILIAGLAGHPVWTAIALIIWGIAVGAARDRIVGRSPSAPVESIDRRRFLINLGGVTASITVVGALVAAALRTSSSKSVVHAKSEVELPDRTGAIEPAPGTRLEYTPVADHYRIDINLLPMKIDGDSWRLPVTGLVERPLNLSLEDFRNFAEQQHLFVTLACISNPIGGDLIGTTRWSGVSVRRVLRDAGISDRARFLKITSDDGFYETVPLDLINSDDRVMFTYLWDGKPLTSEHGFPLRIYIPDRYGMKQPKWIIKAELIENDEPGYWVARGWDKTAQVKATSVIDTVAVESIHEKDGQKLVPIGGIAHAGARGISRVEIQVDEGSWVPAVLRPPLSDLTWVIWRYDWPFQPGKHIFRVRCYDATGAAQIEVPAEPHPSGATGIFSLRRTL